MHLILNKPSLTLLPQDYSLIWEPTLTNIRAEEPMDYEPSDRPPRVEDKVQPKEIREFHTE